MLGSFADRFVSTRRRSASVAPPNVRTTSAPVRPPQPIFHEPLADLVPGPCLQPVSTLLGMNPSAAVRRGVWSVPHIAAFLALFWPTFGWMAERFNTPDSFYSHGWLVPLAAGWLLWSRRRDVRRLRLAPSLWGLSLLGPSIVVHVLAAWLSIHFLSGFAMVAAVWGLVWTLWGWPALQVLRAPLLYLLFMVPLPGVLLIAVSFAMKLQAAGLATWLLQGLGLSATQIGSTIQVPGVSVVVDDTCSGLRSLISLIALAVLWALFLPRGTPRRHRLALVAAALPIALVANMVRILLLVFIAGLYGTQAAEGFIHYGAGTVVFGVALLTLIGLSGVLPRWLPASSRS